MYSIIKYITANTIENKPDAKRLVACLIAVNRSHAILNRKQHALIECIKNWSSQPVQTKLIIDNASALPLAEMFTMSASITSTAINLAHANDILNKTSSADQLSIKLMPICDRFQKNVLIGGASIKDIKPNSLTAEELALTLDLHIIGSRHHHTYTLNNTLLSKELLLNLNAHTADAIENSIQISKTLTDQINSRYSSDEIVQALTYTEGTLQQNTPLPYGIEVGGEFQI